MIKIPWETTDEYIRSGHRDPSEFQPDSLRTITLSEEEGIKAVIGKPEGSDTTQIQSYLFDKDKWTLDKAKAWFDQHHHESKHEHFCYVTPILEKIVDKPLKIRGIALTAGMSRNLNIYLPEELENLASKLVGSPVYVEHVSAFNAVGKVTKACWDANSKTLFYEAEIYDDEAAEKIRKGLIQHVSVGADYERIDILDGKVPHGLHSAELSLVAVPGVPQTNIQIMEKLVPEKQPERPQLRERVWTRRYISQLPDSAFAIVYKEDDRVVRKFPHHDAQGKIDLPHLRNALARVPQSDLTDDQKERALAHLRKHAKAAGIGQFAEEAIPWKADKSQIVTLGGKPLKEQEGEQKEDQEPQEVEFDVAPEPTTDELIASVEDIVSQINDAIEALASRIEKLEQAPARAEGERSVAEELLKPSRDPNLIDKREILKLIPEQRIVRSWSYGPRQLVNQLRYKLSQSSMDRE